MSNDPFRKIVVLVLALVQPFASLFHDITGQGQAVVEFARDGNDVLKAAGYAFSIWGLLYAACMAFGVYQAWPRKTGDSALVRRMGWPAALAFTCCIAWVIAAQLDLKWLTIPIILAGALALVLPLLAAGRAAERAEGRERWLVLWPLGALAGWLTIAGAVNLVTVLAATDNLVPPLSEVQWALLILIGFALVAVIVATRTHLLPYAITFGWGLVAVAVAEWSRHPILAYAALAALAAVALALRLGTRRAPILT